MNDNNENDYKKHFESLTREKDFFNSYYLALIGGIEGYTSVGQLPQAKA